MLGFGVFWNSEWFSQEKRKKRKRKGKRERYGRLMPFANLSDKWQNFKRGT